MKLLIVETRSKMKKILFIQRTMAEGGAEKVLINILNNFNYQKYKVTLLLIEKSGIYLDDININVEVKTVYNPKKFKSRVLQSLYCRIVMFLYNKYPQMLYRIITKNIFDVEIAFLEDEATKFLYNSSNKKSKKIAWIHTDLKKYGKDKLKEMEKHYYQMDNIICVSNEAKRSFDIIFDKLSDKSRVIYNSINIDEITKLSMESIDYNFKKRTVIAVGRLVKEKRFDILIKAHKMLIDEGIEHELIILGDGYERDKLIELINLLNINETIKLLGFKKNPYPYMKNSSLFVISSEFEGFSLVVCEALLLGTPIISTRCTGPTEILEDGRYGYMVKCNDELLLKKSIKEMLLNEDIRKRYMDIGKNKINQFKIEYIIDKIYEIINT